MAFNNIPPNGFPQIPDIEDLEAVVKDVTTLKTTTAEQGATITNLNSTKANKTDIATEFSDLTNYNVGDLVYYEGALYEFQVDHTAGAWETSEVIQKDLSDIVTTLKSGLTIHTASIQTTNAVGIAYRIGNIITININNGASFSADSGDLLFTLPEGYRPDGEISILNAIGDKQRIALYSDGNVSAREAFSNTYIRFCVTFIKA